MLKYLNSLLKMRQSYTLFDSFVYIFQNYVEIFLYLVYLLV